MHNLNSADEEILESMLEGRDEGKPWGRNLPKNMSEKLDFSRQYIQSRFQLLQAAGLMRQVGGGLRELTEEGIEAAEDVQG